jgi:hypothetical protein
MLEWDFFHDRAPNMAVAWLGQLHRVGLPHRIPKG